MMEQQKYEQQTNRTTRIGKEEPSVFLFQVFFSVFADCDCDWAGTATTTGVMWWMTSQSTESTHHINSLFFIPAISFIFLCNNLLFSLLSNRECGFIRMRFQFVTDLWGSLVGTGYYYYTSAKMGNFFLCLAKLLMASQFSEETPLVSVHFTSYEEG